MADALTITVLGSAGTYPRPGNPASGYLVQSPTTAIWLDAGSGSFAALQAHVDLAAVDAIVLSHEHPDHWLDLPVARNAAKYVLGIDRLPVYGTAGTRALAEALINPLEDPIRWHTVTDGAEVEIGDVALRFAATDHPVETLAVRLTAGGRTAAYSADTGSAWSFAALDHDGSGVDLAVCEASLPGDEADRFQHLTPAQAGAMARAAGVRRLVLTHLPADAGPHTQEQAGAPDAFAGPVTLAQPGRSYVA